MRAQIRPANYQTIPLKDLTPLGWYKNQLQIQSDGLSGHLDLFWPDIKDSKWIGDLFRIGLVKSSFIPAKDIRILRELTRYRYKLTSMKSSEKNRFQNAFTVCNVALDSVVSDMFGKSATAITDYLTSDENFDAKHCISLLHHSLKKKADDVFQAIEGYEMTAEQKTRIGIVRDHLHYIDALIERRLQ